jgi:hypothetical protein
MLGDTGWICPGCGRCYAPWVRTCDSCGVTTGTFTIPKMEECAHIWGIMTTMGQACTKCGQLDRGSEPHTNGGHYNCNLSNCPVCGSGGTCNV